MSFFDKVKQGATEAAKKAQQSAAEAARKAQQAMEATKLRGQISGKEKDRDQLFRQIGESVYRTHENGTGAAGYEEEVAGYLRQLDEIKMEIELIEERIRHLRSERTCSCGKIVPHEANFCPECGAQLASPEPRYTEVEAVEGEEADETAEDREPILLPEPPKAPEMAMGEIRVICSRCLTENALTAKTCVTCGSPLSGGSHY